MNLLVTGGAGFIGSNFILYWLKVHPNDKIVNLDKLTYAGNLENLKNVEDHPGYSFIQGDISNPEIVIKAMDGADVVVHFAAESHVDRSIHDPAPFIETNVLGTCTLLECALKLKIKRFHHISTDEVFGSLDVESSDKFNEVTPYRPSSPYASSKASSDHFVSAYHKTYGLPVTMSNCSNNFGPYQFPEKLIPLAITNLMEGKKIPVYGDGKNVRDWLYVTDHVRAIEAILLNGKIGETYCIGGNTENLNNIKVVEKILRLMNADESRIEFVTDRKGHDRKYALDWTKIRNKLGWQPEHNFDEWLEQTVEWYRNNKSWWKAVKSGQYQTYYKRQYGDRS